jgi:hypothetical protein
VPGQQFIVQIPEARQYQQVRRDFGNGFNSRGGRAAARGNSGSNVGRHNGNNAELGRLRNERRGLNRETFQAEIDREEEELQMALSMSAETALFEQLERESQDMDDQTEEDGGDSLTDENGKPVDLENAKVLRECELCLDDIVVGHRLRTLPCMHIFHVRCANMWLR